eukprot:TRINITY_DN1362_c0_g1_i2.p1 TRINITY_DN1362_c0_g1~~TRINITY_DN1362_c0_g1_i2.p1  ORF type:complete len:157 (-),score=44.96 TRINITY_DN1362_c0_g1_i2:139-549(-)
MALRSLVFRQLSAIVRPRVAFFSSTHHLADATFPSFRNKIEKEPRDVRFKRMLWRAKQRGMLELDILLGKWAERHMHKLTEAQLQEFDQILDLETPELLKYIDGRLEIPEELQTPLLLQLRDYVSNKRDSVLNPQS